MKKLIPIMIIILLITVPAFALKPSPDDDVSGGQAPPQSSIAFEMLGYGTLVNSYNLGLADTWFYQRSGAHIDDGSPVYYGLDLRLLFGIENFSIGFTFGFIIPISHSIWGTQIIYGGKYEIVLDPHIMTLGLPIKYRISDSVNVVAEPAMLIGWVTGKYTDPNPANNKTFDAAPGVGFGIMMGIEYFLFENFGISLNAGARVLTTDLMYADTTSGTGYSQPVLNNGTPVTVDLGGFYIKIGVMLHI